MSVTTEQLEAALDAALRGPERRKLQIGHRKWNVKPAQITRNGDFIRVDGLSGRYISRRRSRLPNDRYYYEIEKEGSQIKKLDIDRRSGLARLVKAAREIYEVAREIYEDSKKSGKSDAMATQDADREARKLLDGSSRGIAGYVITHIALRAK